MSRQTASKMSWIGIEEFPAKNGGVLIREAIWNEDTCVSLQRLLSSLSFFHSKRSPDIIDLNLSDEQLEDYQKLKILIKEINNEYRN